MYSEAERHQLDGDQEMAYIFYYKFFNVVTHIRSTPEYKADTKYFNIMMNKKKAMNAIEQLALLKESLMRRYSEQNDPPSRPPSAGGGGNRDAAWSPSPSDTRAPSPLPPAKGAHHTVSIDVHEFVRLIKDPQVGVLVMDCRPSEEFAASRIDPEHVPSLNVSQEIVKPGYGHDLLAGTHPLTVYAKSGLFLQHVRRKAPGRTEPGGQGAVGVAIDQTVRGPVGLEQHRRRFEIERADDHRDVEVDSVERESVSLFALIVLQPPH